MKRGEMHRRAVRFGRLSKYKQNNVELLVILVQYNVII